VPDFLEPAKDAAPFRHLDVPVSPLPTLAANNALALNQFPTIQPDVKPLSPATAGALFPHFADQPPAISPALIPHKVKTVPVTNDVDPMLDDIAKTNNRLRHETDRPQSRTTAGNLLREMGEDGLTGLNQYAYTLATVERESRGGTAMREEYFKPDRDAHFEKKYGVGSGPAKNLGNDQPGDGAAYPGRGLVQLTGKTGYTRWTNRLTKEGVLADGAAPDLVHNPELAADPAIATKIAVEGMRDGTFTGVGLPRYVNENKTDYVNARRVINGTDAAEEIADRARTYENVLKGHSNEFYGAMLAAKESKLPMAREAAPLQTISNDLSGMYSPTPLGSGAEHFGPVKNLFDQPLGHFKPVAADKNLKITNIKPAHAATTDQHDPAHS
jgi:hypothetical protein